LLDYVGKEEWEVVDANEWAPDYDGAIFENALNGRHGPLKSPAYIVEGVKKAATNFMSMIASTLRQLRAESTDQ
jgi:hypothetical protein